MPRWCSASATPPCSTVRRRNGARSCCRGAEAVQLNLERPDYQYFLRGADGRQALVNERILTRSFIVSPDSLVEDWPVVDVTAMQPADLDAALALGPELIVLGTGEAQRFPPAAVRAA